MKVSYISPMDVAYIIYLSRWILLHVIRDGSRAAATSKMECFVIIVNGWMDVAAALDPPLVISILS